LIAYAKGSRIRWTETPGTEPARVYVHGLGSLSAVYHAHIAARPELAGRRSLFVDLPGHGISDRTEDFGYTLDDHADALAAALDAAGLTGAELIAHSMGGAVAVMLAHRRPDLVSRLVLTEANLDASRRPPPEAAESPPTERTSSSKAATPACWRKSALCGRRPCGWPTRAPCTAPPSDSGRDPTP
jgi:pimeloyl-ACP methyl ester carboxylesterase